MVAPQHPSEAYKVLLLKGLTTLPTRQKLAGYGKAAPISADMVELWTIRVDTTWHTGGRLSTLLGLFLKEKSFITSVTGQLALIQSTLRLLLIERTLLIKGAAMRPISILKRLIASVATRLLKVITTYKTLSTASSVSVRSAIT